MRVCKMQCDTWRQKWLKRTMMHPLRLSQMVLITLVGKYVWKSIFSPDGRFIEGCSNPSETEGVRRSTILSNVFDPRPLRFIVRQFCRTSWTHGRSASSFDKVVVQFVERVRPTAAPVLRVTVSPNGFDPQPLRPVVQRFHTGFTRIPHGLHRDFTWMSQGFQKDFKRILQEFNPNFTIVSQDYFLRFSNSIFSMLLVEEEDEQ